mmetsp:Transcript_21027/g.26606  ORF Transcript_21027/g.26606 Transcript_21027/m.26606 type:complete len:91 (+) Transcript_21027:46-318(+)
MAEEQHLYKIIVIGDYAVGKTCIIKRYCEGVFTPHYKLTIGVDFAVKVVDWDDSTRISLQVRRTWCFVLFLFLCLFVNLYTLFFLYSYGM